MHDFARVFLCDWLRGIAVILAFPFYPAIIGLAWCIFRIFKRKVISGRVLGGTIFIAYFPIALTTVFTIVEQIYIPHGVEAAYIVYTFGIGMLVDIALLPPLIWALWRRRKLGAASGYPRVSGGGIDARLC